MRPRRRYLVLAAVACAGLVAAGLAWSARAPTPDEVFSRWRVRAADAPIVITYPRDETVFPPELPAPAFRWSDPSGADTWVVAVESTAGRCVSGLLSQPQWTPDDLQWQRIKNRSVEADARAVVLGLRRRDGRRVVSAGTIRFRASKDPVVAPIFYREVNLPFSDAVKDPRKIRWRFGPISSRRPPVVLENLPVCGNCHSFSADGTLLGMDIDYANDKGSYALAAVKREIVLDNQSIITWADYRRSDKELTFGLLSQVSPDGRYVVSTVKDRSVFVPMSDLAYSQLFFPVKGILVVYDRQTKTFRALPGADDPAYVQSNPAWSPDGKEIVFARSRAYPLQGVGAEALLRADQCREFVEGRQQFRFDLYRVPFNGGAGGVAVPVEGAGGNGLSNYFARFSPDGKWIVFCRAKSFMLLQADSELYIIPAAGGEARRLRCNLAGMNSWHSWSPNSRWLVFASKTNGPYTQLWLAHVDESGNSSPPVLLEQFTAPDRAGNIPEFVAAAPQAIAAIRERFVNDDSFFRSGDAFLRGGDAPGACAMYEKALATNPDNARAHHNLGAVLARLGRDEEAARHLRRALALDPALAEAHTNLGAIHGKQGRLAEAMAEFDKALAMAPRDLRAHLMAAQCQIRLGRPDQAVGHWQRAIEIDPALTEPRLSLATIYTRQRRYSLAAQQLEASVKLPGDGFTAASALAWLLATCPDEAIRDGRRAVELAQGACRAPGAPQPLVLDTLAASYAEAGRFPEAIATAEKMLTLTGPGRPGISGEISKRLERYRAGQAWRQE